MKNMFFNSVLVAFVLLVASCSKQPEAKVDVMSFNIRLDHVADSLNNWKYRKDAAAQMIIYYAPDVVAGSIKEPVGRSEEPPSAIYGFRCGACRWKRKRGILFSVL